MEIYYSKVLNCYPKKLCDIDIKTTAALGLLKESLRQIACVWVN